MFAYILTPISLLSCAAALNFIVVGDWGAFPVDTIFGQRDVANAMARWAGDHPLDFIISTGDNFYQVGVDSVDDPQFDSKWKYMYNHTTLRQVPWYQCVGNHDHGLGEGEEWHQVEYGRREPRWVFPHLWHSWEAQVGNVSALFVVLDTASWRGDKNNASEMVPWLDRQLGSSSAKWKFVIGHRPVFSAGSTGPSSNRMRRTFQPIFERHQVDAYICGHDHNLQDLTHNMTNGRQMKYVVSGSGGAANYFIDDDNIDTLRRNFSVSTHFAEEDWGFTSFQLEEARLTVRYYNETSDPANFELHNFVLTK